MLSQYKWGKEISTVYKGKTFEHFIQDIYEEKDEKMRYISQVKWMMDEDKHIEVDYIGRFETLEESWSVVQDKLGIDIPIGHRYQTSVQDYREKYTDEMRDMIAEAHAADIEKFNYKF